MLQPSPPRAGQAPPPKDAARPTVGERLVRILHPSHSSATPLRWLALAMLALAASFPCWAVRSTRGLRSNRFSSARWR